MVQIGLGPSGEPEAATYAQHDSGEQRPFKQGPKAMDLVERDGALHPVVYVAPYSHPSYFKGGVAHPYVLGIDHPFGEGPEDEPPVVPFGDWVLGPLGKQRAHRRRPDRRWGPQPGLPGPQVEAAGALARSDAAAPTEGLARSRDPPAGQAHVFPPRPRIESSASRRAAPCSATPSPALASGVLDTCT